MSSVRQVYAKRQVAELVAGERIQEYSDTSELSIGEESDLEVISEEELIESAAKKTEKNPSEMRKLEIDLTAATQKESLGVIGKSSLKPRESSRSRAGRKESE